MLNFSSFVNALVNRRWSLVQTRLEHLLPHLEQEFLVQVQWHEQWPHVDVGRQTFHEDNDA